MLLPALVASDSPSALLTIPLTTSDVLDGETACTTSEAVPKATCSETSELILSSRDGGKLHLIAKGMSSDDTIRLHPASWRTSCC